jgi:site-specific DNA-methyltransferase (adenine-specific)
VSAPEPYWSDDRVQLYLGDMRDVLPALGITADCIIADPPYGETSLPWDLWPDGWLEVAATITRSLWCFGSLRMFLAHRDEFAAAGWKLSQDVIWVKNITTSMSTDRFARCHETLTHWYQGRWADTYHQTPRDEWLGEKHSMPGGGSLASGNHLGAATLARKPWIDDGTRQAVSVRNVKAMFRHGGHPTEKPVRLLDPLITYACPPGGLVVVPFAGSGSDLDAARCSGRRAVGIEAWEPYAHRAARRLSQGDLFGDGAA